MGDTHTIHVDPPQSDEALRLLDAEIEKAVADRRDLDGQYRSARDQLDTHLSKLRTARRTMLRKHAPRRRKPRSGPLDPAAQAGAGNLKKVLEATRKHPVATQARLSKISGVGTGSMTHAIKALEARGDIEFTGNLVNGSKEFRYTGTKRRVRRPGESK